MSEEIKDCSDEIKDRMDALAKKMQTCRQCKEDYFNLKDGLCAWCCGWRAKKAVSVPKKPLAIQTYEDHEAWHERRDIDG